MERRSPTEQSIMTIETSEMRTLFGRTLDISVPLRVFGRIFEVSVPADGEEHVLRCDGERLYLDGEPIAVRGIAT